MSERIPEKKNWRENKKGDRRERVTAGKTEKKGKDKKRDKEKERMRGWCFQAPDGL